MQHPSSSSSRSDFLPRREFIREQKSIPREFAIVIFSGSSFIRLYSFPAIVTAAFHRFFNDRQICLALREVSEESFSEFTLGGKPWTSPKSVDTEKLIVDIFAFLYHRFGYTFLSTFDYGRDADDLLALVFSKPCFSVSSRTGTPVPTSNAPEIRSGASPDIYRQTQRVPFAISFASATCMRVISPPLHLTPAILQAVRNSCTRGVIKERNVGDNSFEFRLQGYKWFEQDTFSTDALKLIQTLLTSLDAQSFSFLSSISLKKRSRVKDLWVFTAPAYLFTDESHQDNFTSAASDSSKKDLPVPVRRESPFRQYPIVNPGLLPQHRRFTSEPSIPTNKSPSRSLRPIAEPPHYESPRPSNGEGVLERAVSPSSPPKSIHSPDAAAGEPETPTAGGVRAILPSVVSSTVENMTGVGAQGFPPDVYRQSPAVVRKDSNVPPDYHLFADSTVTASHIPTRSTSTRRSSKYPSREQQGSSNTTHNRNNTKPTRSRSLFRKAGDLAHLTADPEASTPNAGRPSTTNHELNAQERAKQKERYPEGNKTPSDNNRKNTTTSPSPSPAPARDGIPGSPVLHDNQAWVLVNIENGSEKVPLNGKLSLDSSNHINSLDKVGRPGPGSHTFSASPQAKVIAVKDAAGSEGNGKPPGESPAADIPSRSQKKAFKLMRKPPSNWRRSK